MEVIKIKGIKFISYCFLFTLLFILIKHMFCSLHYLPYQFGYRFNIVSIIISMTIIMITWRFRIIHRIKILNDDLFNHRKLIFSLALNDFKNKYAGSYFGIFWAFVQPIVTIILFWFVFQVGFRSTPINDVPFVLWLICGIIPWFFFSEAITNATNTFIDYSYLVKKVIFKVSVLPLAKVVSALFIHLFFIVFIMLVFALSGRFPDIFTLQIVYYIVCLFAYIVSLSLLTSSIIVFFRDFGQIISIILQLGIWATPIMWSVDAVPNKIKWIFELNPMFYIVMGYRDCFIYKIWFFSRMNLTIYFWLITLILFLLGVFLFKKSRPHFADVL